MDNKTPKPRSPNVQFYLYPEDKRRLDTVLARENVIADQDGKKRVTKSGELEKLVLKYIDRMENKHSEMKMFRPDK